MAVCTLVLHRHHYLKTYSSEYLPLYKQEALLLSIGLCPLYPFSVACYSLEWLKRRLLSRCCTNFPLLRSGPVSHHWPCSTAHQFCPVHSVHLGTGQLALHLVFCSRFLVRVLAHIPCPLAVQSVPGLAGWLAGCLLFLLCPVS